MQLVFPRWKYLVLLVTIIISIVYALPNIYGEDPSIQITGTNVTQANFIEIEDKVKDKLRENKISFKSSKITDKNILIRFYSTQVQINAKDIVKEFLGEDYTVALNLAPVTPFWLDNLGATPMKLGLDLRGGVRFLMEVDVASNIKRRLDGYYSDLRNSLREEKIRYNNIKLESDNSISITFSTMGELDSAYTYINQYFKEVEIFKHLMGEKLELILHLSQAKITEIRNYTVEQTVVTLRNRVNELGVAEAVVQRQGFNQVVVELPGIQDTARAKDILGKTATLDFVLVDSKHDIHEAIQGKVPIGSKILSDKRGVPYLLKKHVVLTGDSIVGASSGFDNRDGSPSVSVRIGGRGVGLFKKTTLDNIGKPMAVVYRETKVEDRIVDGETVRIPKTKEVVISVATIQTALGTNFQITGLTLDESRDLALLLRAGALPATITIVEERIIGPSLGQENIEKGLRSILVGLCLVLFVMALYYRKFGLIANAALLLNITIIVAVMSLLGATLTLPGIAGIVLTLGMAVDANVLIFERIREEYKSGITPIASIHRGFDQAFSSIIDANVTTLIAGIIMFAVGTGPVKGFAVTLCIGILTSLFTAITGTRALINLFYCRESSIRNAKDRGSLSF